MAERRGPGLQPGPLSLVNVYQLEATLARSIAEALSIYLARWAAVWVFSIIASKNSTSCRCQRLAAGWPPPRPRRPSRQRGYSVPCAALLGAHAPLERGGDARQE